MTLKGWRVVKSQHNQSIKKHKAKFVADDILIFFFFFSEKTSFDISCESSAKQTIHMKYQDLFSLKNKKNKIKKLSSAAVVTGALRVNA